MSSPEGPINAVESEAFTVYFENGRSSTIKVSREPGEHRHAISRLWRAIRMAEARSRDALARVSHNPVVRIAVTYVMNGVPVDMESWTRDEVLYYMCRSDSDFRGE